MKPNNMRIGLVGILSLVISGCTGPINSTTTRDMPSGYLCDILGPDYITLPSERKAIYAELERREAECIKTIGIKQL